MGSTRGRKKSASRRSRESRNLRKPRDLTEPGSVALLSKEIVLRGGNSSGSSGARETIWAPFGSCRVDSIGAVEQNECPNRIGKDGPLATASFNKPISIDMDSAGNIILVEKESDSKIRMISPQGNVSTVIKGSGVNNISMCVVNKIDDVFYFVEYGEHSLKSLLSANGNTFSGQAAPGFTAGINTIIGTSGNRVVDGNENNAYFHHPISIGIDGNPWRWGATRIYVGEDTGKHLRMIEKYSARSSYVTTLFKSIQTIKNITVDNSGNVFFTIRDGDNNLRNKHAIWKFVPPAAAARTTGARTSEDDIVPLYSFTDPIYGPKVFAGNADTSGYKDGFGATARFNSPTGMCVDEKNNLYVADCGNNLIRCITPRGQVYTYAGVQSTNPNLDGVPNRGDGSHMTARFSNPISIAMDKLNSLFVLDAGRDRNNTCVAYCRIRKISYVPPITITGIETNSVTLTWPPQSEWMPSGQNPYNYEYAITPADMNSKVSGGRINSPHTITNLSDSTRYSIQVVISNPSNTLTTLPIPFVTKIEESKFAIRTPVSTTVGGKGIPVPSITSTLLEWDGVKDADTLSYSISPPDAFSRSIVALPRNQKPPYSISDLDINQTYTVTLTASITNLPEVNGGPLSTYTVTSPSSTFTTPPLRSMQIGTICGLVNEGGAVTNATKIPIPSSTAKIHDPRGVVLDKHGNLFVTSRTCVLKIVSPNTNIYVHTPGQAPSVFLPHITSNSTISIYAGKPYNTDSNPPSDTTGDNIRFYNIACIAYDPLEDALYVSDPLLHIIIKLTADSAGVVRSKVIGKKHDENFESSLVADVLADGPIAEAKFLFPKDIAIGPDGSLFIADSYNNAVRRVYKGNVTTIARAKRDGNNYVDNLLTRPHGIAVNNGGTVYVTSTGRNSIKKITPNSDGTYTTTLYAGQDASTGSDADGTLLNARFNNPQGLCIDVNNNIYVYDVGNYKIKVISGERVMTVFGGTKGYKDGDKNDAQLKGVRFIHQIQEDYSGLISDNNGNIYFTDWGNGLLRCAFPETPPVIDKATYDRLLVERRESSAVAQTTSSARRIQASSARIQGASSAVAQRESSSLAQIASSPIAQVASSAVASSALAQRESSSLAQIASSPIAQVASSAVASSALAQRESSSLAQIASSPVAQVASSAVASSALAQKESSAVAQVASSAVAQGASSAQVSSALAQKESSAVAQVASSAVAQGASSAQVSSALAQKESSAVAQVASSAVAQGASSAQVSSALAQKESSAVAQVASSAVAQGASSAVAQRVSSAKESSAVAQVASSAVIQRASSAVAQRESSAQESSAVARGASSAVIQRASSAVAQRASSAQESSAKQLEALTEPVSEKDAIVRRMKIIQSDLSEGVAVMYSKTSTQEQKNSAQGFIRTNIPDLQEQWAALSKISASIFSIAPMYQDRVLQTAIYDDKYLESKNLIKMYDLMRNRYITIDSKGYIVSNVGPTNRLR